MAEKRRASETYSHLLVKYHAQQSIIGFPGKEGLAMPEPLSQTGKHIGVFTSGGDCSGMNAAVRAVVRLGIYFGCRVYLIKEGYQGMVDGGDYIVEATWADVSGIIEKGGTIIGTARCAEFREKSGRLKAAKNLVTLGIANLVCIGGDGSLTGANLFRNEWPDLLQELVSSGEITEDVRDEYNHLYVVGILGSIDNDFCGTDMTIGTDSALHRIIEAVDAIATTAASDQKCFVLEIMGRHCGYLALVAAMACEADFVFIPEYPHLEGWEEKLIKKLQTEQENGQRIKMIFVSEGAVDLKGNPITVAQILDLVRKRLKIEIRATVLGHVQRGGRPSAFDRILGTRMGAEAVHAILDSQPTTPSVIIALDGNQIVRKQLMQCVERTKEVNAAMREQRFDDCVVARGRSFISNLNTYKTLSRLEPPKTGIVNGDGRGGLKFAMVAVGAPACGANAAARAFVRKCLFDGYEVLAVYDSLAGLAIGNVKPLKWMDVHGWAAQAGSVLGTRRTLPQEVGFEKLAISIANHNISGLVIIGGFEAYQTALQLENARTEYPQLQIPVIVIPSTISNNIPGTDFTLGCDTALNEIVSICDRLKLSALGSKRRVFLVETMGGYCGYLATLAGLAGGADAAYIHEEEFTCQDLVQDCDHMCNKMDNSEIKRGLILVNEKANSHFTTNFIYQLFSESGKDFFSTRMNIVGHMQQGGSASPYDRLLGTKLGLKAADQIIELCGKYKQEDGKIRCNTSDSVVLAGIIKRTTEFTPVSEFVAQTDFQKRLPNNQWWLKMRPLLRILAKHEAIYAAEAEDDTMMSSRQPSTVNLFKMGRPKSGGNGNHTYR